MLSNTLIDYAESLNFGELHFKFDPKTGLRAIVSIHSTKLGPTLGGCRFIEYDTFDHAVHDALRLARGMTFKSAMAGLPIGGGKGVILKPKHIEDRRAFFHSYGEFVNDLGGRYTTAVDSGSTAADMDMVAEKTKYVLHSAYNGDPSVTTAEGVLCGLEAAIEFKLGRKDFEGLHIALQGVGKVGYYLSEMLHKLGATLTVADIHQESVNRCVKDFGANAVASEEIIHVDCDILSPSALGAVLDENSIPNIKASIIGGCANNQLAQPEHGKMLHDRGILYAPDYIINAGGLIHAVILYTGIPIEKEKSYIENIYTNLMQVFQRSEQENRPTSEVADIITEEKIL